MAEEASRSRNPAGHAGLLDNVLALASALAVFLESRLALIVRDSKAALLQMIGLAICLGAAVMLFGFAYLFLIASAIVGVAHFVHVSWLWIALAAAALHLVGAFVFVFVARAWMTKPLFRATASELKKDREWLKDLNRTTRPRS
jgi:uncharacterized membrane protein YqjE